MPSTAMSSWDGYGGQQIFPADMPFHHHHHHQDTLEAVFQQPDTTGPLQAPPAAAERELLLRNGGSPVPAPAVEAVHAAAAPRRRPFRTDRHSKIRTAQGVRDRRMRLSVGVAREFFALQDRLGFDKPSKTVNWLLTQSKPAIDRLVDGAAEPPRAAAAAAAVVSGAAVMRGRGEGSSSSTCCLTADSREETATEKAIRSRAGAGGGPDDGPSPAALLEEHGCGELGWIMTEATAAAAAATTAEQPQQMDGLEYYYQYCLQLEEMMRCNGGTPR